MSTRHLLSALSMLSLATFANLAQAETQNFCTVDNGCADLTDNDGYWVAKIKTPASPFKISIINDMHIDADTKAVTVYAQSRLFGKVVAPAQLSPGECEERQEGKVCFHPDAVYLNESGQEQSADDGSGAWWVKHAWILDGQGYDNSELKPMAEYPETYVEGVLLESGVHMKIGNPSWGHNIRGPVYFDGSNKVEHFVTRYQAVEQADGSYIYEPDFVLSFECQNEASAFDGVKRGCPKASD